MVLEKYIDLGIIEWLYEYSKIGSVRRELDNKLYTYFNFINTILELKNINMLVKDNKRDLQKTMHEIKVPVIKEN